MKPKVSASFLRWNKPAIRSYSISHGSTSAGKIAATKSIARTSSIRPLSLGFNHDFGGWNVPFVCTTPGYTSLGNPCTMTFLSKRGKSSCAAVNHDLDGDEGENVSGCKTHVGVNERSHQEAWMVNIGRGDEAWLSGPRHSDWFTGLEPIACPGKSVFCLFTR